MLDISIGISLVIFGFFIGILASLVGIGGGLVAIPVLMFIFNLTNPQASAISLLVVVGTSSVGTFTFLHQRRIDIRTGLYFASLSVPSAFIGARLADILEANFLTIIFGTLLILVAVRKIISFYFDQSSPDKSKNYIRDRVKIQELDKKNLKYNRLPQSIENRLIVDNNGETFYFQIRFRKILVAAIIGGFTAGLLGVGGGVIFVPVFSSIGGFPVHIATATSTFIIFFTSISGSLARIAFGTNLLIEYVVYLGIGTVIGARLGALNVRRISSQKILTIFYGIVFIAGLRTIASGLGLF